MRPSLFGFFGSAFALALAAPAAADAPKGGHAPAEDNPYFESDARDPRVLHKKDTFRIDRGLIQKLARPKLEQRTWDILDAAGADQRPADIHVDEIGLAGANLATRVNGRIIVIDGSATTVQTTADGTVFNHNGGGLENVVNTVFQVLGDQFDFITVWTTFSDFSTAAYYLPLQNDVEGLGECNFNAGATFGCQFNNFGGDVKLQGFIFMNSIETWQDWDRNFDGQVFPVDDFNSAIFSTLGQETAHRWGSALRFVDPRNGSVSKKLLGRDQSHWAAYVDTDASVMDGWDWEPDGDAFDLVNDMDVFSTLDLYAMGALPVAAAEPFFFIDNARFTERDTGNFGFGLDGRAIPAGAVLESGLPSVALMEDNGIFLGATGERVDLTIQNIVDAEGNRCPDPDHTQKEFHQAFVLVTRPGQAQAQIDTEVADLEAVADAWEAWWASRTENRLKICVGPDVDCTLAEGELSGGDVEAEDKGVVEPGKKAFLTVTTTAHKAPIKNARIHFELEGAGGNDSGMVDPEGKQDGQFVKLDVEVGDIDVDETKELRLPIQFDGDYPCGVSTIVSATMTSDSSAPVHEEYRIFPGWHERFVESFFDDGHKFEVNADGKDSLTRGGFVRDDIELSCAMTKRTPERDLSPTDQGAFVTGVDKELDGDTSLWSPEISLDGAVAPEVRYGFWLDGEPGDKLLVQLSDDGKKFVTAKEEGESFHGWGLGQVQIREVFGTVPKSVTVRFVFEGNGHLEGAIDEFRVLDVEGQCKTRAVCGCDTQGGAGPSSSLAVLLGLFGLRALRRRR